MGQKFKLYAAIVFLFGSLSRCAPETWKGWLFRVENRSTRFEHRPVGLVGLVAGELSLSDVFVPKGNEGTLVDRMNCVQNEGP